MDDYSLERLREVTRIFPKGSMVRRKPGVKPSAYNTLEEAVVSDVVMTGIFSDTFLKTGGHFAPYLDPDDYEVIS